MKTIKYRPSHEGVAPEFDDAITQCRRAGFKGILPRGDTDFSLTAEFDWWDEDGVRFIFGDDARQNVVAIADGHPDELYRDLERRAATARARSERACLRVGGESTMADGRWRWPMAMADGRWRWPTPDRRSPLRAFVLHQAGGGRGVSHVLWAQTPRSHTNSSTRSLESTT